jgi:hypothetical protein
MVDKYQKDSTFVEGFSCRNKIICQRYAYVNLKVSNTQFLRDIDSNAHKMKVKKMILQVKVAVPTELYGSRKTTSVSLFPKMVIELETYNNIKAQLPQQEITHILFQKIINLVKNHHY